MKQVKYFVFIVVLLLCNFTINAHDFVKNGIYYELPDQIDFANLTVSVTYMGGGYSDYTNEYRGHVEIPSTVTYRGTTYRVVHIGAYAFACCDALTSVVIPSTVTSIGRGAFGDCSSLISINIPKGVTSIGEGAFSGCGSLSSIVVAGGNRVYDSRDNCNAIIKTSNNTLIRGCGKTIIPASVTSIENYAFSNCSSLTSINIPASVTSIGRGTFRSCSSLTSVVLPKNLRRIKELTFSGCSSLASITIPDGVTHIEQEAFYDCSSLTSIIIPASVTYIGAYAFDGCRSLTSVKCPRKFKYLFPKAGFDKVGDFVFYENTLIGYVGNSSDVVLPKSFDGKNYAIGERVFANSRITSITIPENVTSIGEFAFDGCSNLTSITIPEGMRSIGDYAFRDCSSLTSITIPKGMTSIGSNAFFGCSRLTTVTFPENSLLTSIGSNAFDGCRSLTSITIPESVTSIGEYVFDGTAWYNNQPDGVVYAGKVLYKYKGTMPANTSIEVKEGTVSISPSAFRGCSSLTSITIPEGVTSIGRGAFDNCYKLTSVKCPARFRSFFPRVDFSTIVGDFRFLDDGVLVGYVGRSAKVVLPKDFKGKKYHIAERAFEGNSVIKSVTISEGVVGIGTCAFKDCVNLKTVTIPESVTSMGWYVFENCSNLETVKVPQSWKLKGRLGNDAIQGCPNARVMSEKDMNFQTLQISVGAVAAVAVLVEVFKVAGKNSTE